MNLETLSKISENIQVIENFPKQGIIFRNISTLMKNGNLFNKSIEYMSLLIKLSSNVKIDYLVGIESRGFLFSQLANELGCGFVMMRKPGKLPTTKIVSYSKEYGTDSLTIEDNIIEPGSNVIIVDDLIATGGTLCAGIELINMIGSNVVGVIGLIQLLGLELNQKLIESNVPILSLLKYQFNSLENKLDMSINTHLQVSTQIQSDENKIFIKDFIPLKIPDKNNNIIDTIVFSHPTIESIANNYIGSKINSRKGTIIWDKFPDSQPNIKFESDLEDKRIVFFMSVYDTSILFEQLSMIKVLPRQFIKSLDIYICYYSVGTMERVDKEGVLATADTMANIISNCMETCKEGKPTIHIYDIHTLQNRFYFDYNKVQIKLHSGIPLLKNKIKTNSIIVFPDDGAFKRFGHDFQGYKTIVCSKVRDGNKRIITIKDKINFPIDESTLDLYGIELIIVDDLVQSGGTIIECKKALESYGYTKISAYVTHSVFPNEGWKKIIDAKFHKFYTTNSVPEITDKLELIENTPFVVLKLFGNVVLKPQIVYVSSHNIQKLQAAWNWIWYGNNNYCGNYDIGGLRFNYIVKGVNIDSNVPSQPIGIAQTNLGSFNRLEGMKNYLEENNLKYDYLLSYENGIVLTNNDKCQDFCCFSFIDYKKPKKIQYGSSGGFTDYTIEGNIHNMSDISDISDISDTIYYVEVEKKFYDKCLEFGQTKTISEIIQDELGVPKDLFHEFFNEGKKTRVDIMSNIKLNYVLNK
jgi:adenine phosphoribosyltransferase